MTKDNNHSTNWDLMLATAKEVAAQDDSSRNRLKEEFLEEFGQLPTAELLDYFDDLLRRDDLKPSPKPPAQLKDPVREEKRVKDKSQLSEFEYTEKIASQKGQNVDAFRKSFAATYGKEPSLEVVAYFLKNIALHRHKPLQEKGRESSSANETTGVGFVKNFVKTKFPTVLKFRKAYHKKFGAPPSTELITLFLNELSKHN